MRCTKCKMPKGVGGIDSCFCEDDQEAGSGAAEASWDVVPEGIPHAVLSWKWKDAYCMWSGPFLAKSHALVYKSRVMSWLIQEEQPDISHDDLFVFTSSETFIKTAVLVKQFELGGIFGLQVYDGHTTHYYDGTTWKVVI